MKRDIKIRAGEIEASGWFNETDTADKVFEILPLTSRVNVWGDEIYFTISVKTGLENAEETVSLGDVAYWPQGNALCIFFGKTPVSEGEEIRPMSPVNIIGAIEGDRELFNRLLGKFREGEEITISR